ncbi:SDR family NAD(P)-dependent oxidoreductase [Nocardia sp. NPDC059177]|uniref:SDR family NAD(P)-dependent oxidoreductase n=1 Tax=Nocardia sp. NPDC059177 TaxID=3346759 RepID=UPI00369E1236
MSDKDLGATLLLSRTDFVMANHHVHETSVLPGATLLDVVWRLARTRGVEGCLELTGIIFEEPVVTDSRFDRRLRIGLKRRPDGALDVLVTSISVGDGGEFGTVRRHMTATMSILAQPPDPGFADADDLAGPAFTTMDDLYTQARSEHIVHGMPMRALGRLVRTRTGLIADIALDPDHPAPTGFHLHPALLDASTLVAFARTPKLEQPYIPITIAKATLVKPLIGPRCRVWVPAAEVHARTGDVMHNNYDIVDPHGGLVARIERLTCKRIRNRRLISDLTGSDSRGGAQPDPEPLPAVREPRSASTTAEPDFVHDAVRGTIAARLGVQVEHIDSGTGFYELGLDSVALLELSATIGHTLGVRLYPTVLFEYSTVDDLTRYIEAEYRPSRPIAEPAAPEPRTTSRVRPTAQVWAAQWVDIDPAAGLPAGRHTISVLGHDAELRSRLRVALEATGWSVREHATAPDTPDPTGVWCVVAGADQVAAVAEYQDLVRGLGRRTTGPCTALLLGLVDRPVPEFQGTGAFCATAAAEVRLLSAAVLVAERTAPLAAVARSITALVSARKSGLFRLTREHLQALDYRPVEVAAAAPLVRSGGRYLISGGSGGLGSKLAEYLITEHGAAVHLVGRRQPPAATAADHVAWRSRGATVTFTECDVTDPDTCHDTVAELTRQYGRLDGIFHLAGVLDDSVFIAGSAERTRAVLAPKLDGARNLWRAVDPADLDFFVSFTSVSGAVANPGQSAYAYANSSLDFWSRTHRDSPCEVLSIAWPYWEEGGMRAGESADPAAGLPTETALGLLDELLRRSRAGHVCVTYGEPDRSTAQMVTYPDPVAAGAPEPIAIIGMAGSCPGAPDLAAFWQLLQAGEDSVGEIEADAWPEPLAHGPQTERGTSYSRWGSVLPERDHFAPAFFGISRREAESMDPQERQFLMAAWRALEDAARPPESLRTETVGVFCGVMWNHYQLYRDADGVAPTALHSAIPNRVSYTFDFAGPSIALDTACSGSLVAVHLAVQSLRRGESTVALAGGVNITTHPQKYVQLSADTFLSPTGRCRAFGAGADGYVPGDGVGVVVLKPLARAQADGDVVHAVIRGTSVNHNGRSAGFTVPDPAAQAALIAAALAAADVEPAEIGYLEAHGTGTALGDPIEAAAIHREIAHERTENSPLHVGSVKTNLGHLESAAGIAGLIKAVLQVEHASIVPTLHSAQLNAAVVDVAPTLEFPQETIPWPARYASRIAGVSAFGAGGTNAHVIVEAAPQRPPTNHRAEAIDGEIAVLLSADSESSLRRFSADLCRWLRDNESATDSPSAQSVLDRVAKVLGVPCDEIDVDWTLADLGLDPATVDVVLESAGARLGPPEQLPGRTLRELMRAASVEVPLADIAHTLWVGRRHRRVRLAVSCTSSSQLAVALADYADGAPSGPQHSSGVADNIEHSAPCTGSAREIAPAWCAGATLDPRATPIGRRVSLPVAPLDTEECRLGGWRDRATPERLPAESTEEQIVSLPSESGSGHSFSLLPHGIGLLRLDSPATHNMLTDDLLELLGSVLAQVDADDAVRVLVIAGNGDEFCLGGTPEAVSDVAAQRTTFADAAVVYEGLAACRKPVVTALAGNAFGGGLAFGLYGDLVVMSRDAYYAANFLRHGITPGMGASYILEQRLGSSLSQEMLLTGSEYSGRELERRGAPVKFCDGDRVVAEAMSLARVVAGHRPDAVRELKAHLSSPARRELPAAIAAEMSMHRALSEPAAESKRADQGRIRQADHTATVDVASVIVTSLADILFAEPPEIDTRQSFRDQGLDSVGAVQLVRDLNSALATDLESTIVYEYPTVEELSNHLAGEIATIALLTAAAHTTPTGSEGAEDAEAEPDPFAEDNGTAVAVVGMAGRWPDADDLEQFARNIAAGRSAIGEVNGRRWGAGSNVADSARPDGRWAALIDDIESFDHAFFHLSPLDVAAMDCQQRLFLTESWNALDAAGHLTDVRNRGRTGVYVGCAPGDHGEQLRVTNSHETAQAFLGSSASILAARISYFLNLRGPAIAVDTACSSSLVAVHLACQALLTGEVDTALAGGVAVMETPSLQVRSANVGMLSPTGTSAPFDASADGIVLGEGVGVVVLRRLRDALRDGDNVLAVVRGTGVNGDGHTNGITAPNASAQAELMVCALQRAGVEPRDISFVETHGTGTPLGDPIEIAGLRESLAADEPAWLGSVKANIGHTTTAAGISSLIKAVLCLQMEIVPPLANYAVPNPEINGLGRFRVPATKHPWPYRPGAARTAAVASYGFSGTNSVVIVQDAPPSLPWRNDAAGETAGSTGGDGSVEFRIRPDHPVVADHVIAGTRLLPGAATIEFTRSLLDREGRPGAFALSGVRWRTPLTVENNAVITISARVTGLDPDDVTKRLLAIGSADETVAVTASLEVLGDPAATPDHLDLQALAAACHGTVRADRLYAEFADAGLDYGARYRRLGEIRVGDNLVVGVLNPIAPGFGAETAMLDAALQSLGAMPGLGDGSALVPVAVRRISMWGWSTRATTVIGERTGTTYRVRLTDSAGSLVAEFDGLRLHPMTAAAIRVNPDPQAGGTGLLYPVWLPIDARTSVPDNGDLLVIADRSRDDLSAALMRDAAGNATLVPFDQPHALRGTLTPAVRSVIVLPGPADATLSETLALLSDWCRELDNELGARPVRLSLITRRGVVVEQESPSAVDSAIPGFAGAIAAEQPTWTVRCIDVRDDNERFDRIRRALLVEMPDDSTHRVLAVRSEQLLHRVFRPLVVGAGTGLGLGRRLVVVGATGAIGQAICSAHAAEGLGTQVWIGRRPISAVSPIVERVAHTATVHYLQADIGDRGSIEQALSAAERLLGGIDAVVHCAGELRDRRIRDLAADDIAAVVRPRVDGLAHLLGHTFTGSDPAVLVTSSAAALVDSAGQANYAAACRAMDAMAVAARADGRQVTVVNWGYWSGDGVASTSYHRQLLAADGILPLTADSAIPALAAALRSGQGQTLIVETQANGLRHFGMASDRETIPAIPDVPAAASSSSDDPAGIQQARTAVRRAFCDVLGFEEKELTLDATFETYGVSSVIGVQLLERLERDFGTLPPTLLFEAQTIRALARRLATDCPEAVVVTDRIAEPEVASGGTAASGSTGSAGDIAVIGVAGRYPGAPDIDTLWSNLRAGICSLTEVPPERWHWRDHPDPRRGLQPYQAWGGFITDPYSFDAALFSILPKVAEDIDPQERLFLETAWDLLERTGYLGDDTQARAIGVFAGVMYGGYGEIGARLDQQGTPNGAHSAYWSIANRVSYALDLSGPSMAVDTACSSSLTAVHLAVRSLRDGECGSAIAGGVNLVLHPSHLVSLGERNMLAADGRVKVFDDAADGYVPGEGVGAVLLKPLAAALRDGDDIWAVIRETAVNAGGHTSGYTVPNPHAQAEVIMSTLRNAEVAPETISYVEVHGSGTALGDPIEIAALGAAFRGLGSESVPRWVGSVKSNIGHLEGAAGIAGLTKAVLQLRNRSLAPSIGPATVNPRIPFGELGTQPVQRLTEWLPGVPGLPLRAGVSSFGAGGANVHVVVEEAPPRGQEGRSTGPHLVLLSCPDVDRLREYAANLAAFAHDLAGGVLARLAWTSQVGRPAFGHRLAVVCSTGEELANRLQRFAAGSTPDSTAGAGTYLGAPSTRSPASEDIVATAALRTRDLDRLARWWVDGARIEWKQLWRDQPGRLAYPGVPTRRRAYNVPNPARPGTGRPSGSATSLRFEVPKWQPAAIGTVTSAPRSVGVLALADSDQPLAEALIAEARHRGVHAVSLDEDVDTAGDVDALVVLFDPPTVAPVQLVSTVVRVAARYASRRGRTPVRLVCAWQASTHPTGPATAGLLRSVAAEMPVSAAVVDLGGMPVPAAARVLLDETGGGEVAEVRYHRGAVAAREVATMVEADLPHIAPPPVSGGSYVISGGGGRLGVATAAWLADAGADTVWLLGRSPASPQVRELIDRYGLGRIEFRQVDVTDADAVDRALAEARFAGPLRGVIHAAGTLRDALAAGKTRPDIAAVLEPKLTGMRVLDSATANDSLDFFVAYSSLTARNPSPGQTDYAFANAYLDAACRQRDELVRAGNRSGASVSVGWPLWAEGGMRMPTPVLEELRRRHGMVPMATATAFGVLARAIGAGYPVLHVAELETPQPPGPRSTPEPVSAPDPVIAGMPVDQLVAEVRRHAADFLLVPAAEVDLDAELLELGFDSITLTELIERLNSAFGTSLHPAVAFDNPTLQHLADHLRELVTLPVPDGGVVSDGGVVPDDGVVPVVTTPGAASNHEPIAIIGMASSIAAAPSSRHLWNALIEGQDLVRSVPPDRAELHDNPVMAGIRGGFIDDATAFDAEFFGISPREAQVMDPQQRLFLTVCWEAIWDAARAPEDLRGSATGVFVGVSTMDYQDLMSAGGIPDRAHSATGLSHAVLANRVSHMLDLSGPSEAVDTACSSSLVAVHRAIRALRSGECSQAIVGGVNLTLTSGLYQSFADAGMLSERGRCATFDARADGYVRGEGAGAVLLKPLAVALRDNDQVLAVLRGSAVNHAGRTASLTAPSPQGQAAVLRAAYRDANTEFGSIDYLEAHGTGTRLGDPVEIEGIKQALDSGTDGTILVGSIKASVGHLEAAAGMAGLIKTVQILRHRTVPGQLHLNSLNPQIVLAGTPVRIVTTAVDLPTDRDLVAGVSAFGFGGTNAHVVLGSAPSSASASAHGMPSREYVVPLAAHDEVRLAAYARVLAAEATELHSIDRIAATLQRRHSGGRARAILRCRDIADFRAAAAALGDGQPDERCLRADPDGLAERNLDSVVDRWLTGHEVDWSVLWTRIPPVISLPTPPFAPLRHWFSESEPESDPAAEVPVLENGWVHDEVAAILDMERGALDSSRTWRELGLDSIFAVDLAERLTAKLGVAVSAVAVVDAATVDGLRAHIASLTAPAHDLEQEIHLVLERFTGISENAPDDFDAAGLSSIDRLRAVGYLESYFGPLPKTLLYDSPSTVAVAAYLRQTFSAAVIEGFSAAAVTSSAVRAPVPGVGEVVDLPNGRMVRRADLPVLADVGAAIAELSRAYRLENALAGRDIAPFVYVPTSEQWYLDVGWVGDIVLVWGYTGPAESAIDALAEFGDVSASAGARLSVLWPDPLDTVRGQRFGATPFGVMQEIGDIGSFTLTGGAVRRLRGVVNKFARSGEIRVAECRTDELSRYDREVVRLIDAWSASKRNVSPYVGTIRADLMRGSLPPVYRVFLTFVDDDLVAVVVISRLGVQNGYLLDVEFYGPDTPPGCLEYTVTQIVDRLRGEGIDIFSLGATFAIPTGTSANADPILVDELERMSQAGLTPLGNYHFKRKFKPAESPIYLCQPHGERTGVAEIMLLIGDPGPETPDDVQVGPPMDVLSLERTDVELDLISDSWADRDDDTVRARMTELLASNPPMPSWLPFECIVLASSGRQSESMLCRAWPGRRGTVLHNGAFPTWLAALAENRFTAVGIENIETDGLAAAVDRALATMPEPLSFVLIELCPNSAGGVPIPDSQLARIRAVCDRSGTRLVLDSTRIVDNTVTAEMRSESLAEALTRTLRYADATTMSLSKNFALTSGGLVGTSYEPLSTRLRTRLASDHGEFSAIGRAVMHAGLDDLDTAHRLVTERQIVVSEMAHAIRAQGVHVIPDKPTFALCVASDGTAEADAMTLAAHLYQRTGVRVGPHLSSPVYPGLDGFVRLAIPIGYTEQVRAKVADMSGTIGRIHDRRGPQPSWFSNQLGQLRETYLTDLRTSGGEPAPPGNLRVLQRFCPAVRSTVVEDVEGEVEVFDVGTGELPLVLMHPFNIGAGMFAHLFTNLAESRRVVVIHQPGVGRTRTTSTLSLDSLIDLQIRVLDRIGVRGRFHLGGASVGSIFAQWMALSHPDRVASLSLLGGSYKFANRRGRIDKLDTVIADDFAAIQAGGVPVDDTLERSLVDLLLECESMDPRTGLRYLDLFAQGSDLTDRLASIKVPTLVVQGRHDSVVGVSTGQFINRSIPGSEYSELERSGHFVCFTEPVLVCGLVAEFVGRHDR